MNDSVRAPCLGADVGGGLVSLSIYVCRKRPWSFVSWNQSALMSRCFTQPDPRLVIVPRAAAESLCTRSGRCPTDFLTHAAARVATYNSASPLEREVALASSPDFPSLITTQELLLRSVSFAAQSLSANESRYAFCVPAGNGHARCGFMHDVPHDARCSDQCFTRRMSDFSHDILERICRSILTASK